VDERDDDDDIDERDDDDDDMDERDDDDDDMDERDDDDDVYERDDDDVDERDDDGVDERVDDDDVDENGTRDSEVGDEEADEIDVETIGGDEYEGEDIDVEEAVKTGREEADAEGSEGGEDAGEFSFARDSMSVLVVRKTGVRVRVRERVGGRGRRGPIYENGSFLHDHFFSNNTNRERGREGGLPKLPATIPQCIKMTSGCHIHLFNINTGDQLPRVRHKRVGELIAEATEPDVEEGDESE